MDNVGKETHVVSIMKKPRETVAEVRDERTVVLSRTKF